MYCKAPQFRFLAKGEKLLYLFFREKCALQSGFSKKTFVYNCRNLNSIMRPGVIRATFRIIEKCSIRNTSFNNLSSNIDFFAHL